MSKLFATLAIVGGVLAFAAHQAGNLALPSWVDVVPALQTRVDQDAADYGVQFKQIHLQAEKDILAHKYNGPTAAKDLHDWLSQACDAARNKSFSGVSKPLADALTGADGWNSRGGVSRPRPSRHISSTASKSCPASRATAARPPS